MPEKFQKSYDALVVGAGPNGLSAAIQLARAGISVCVFEAEEQIGGGARTMELTLPGFQHDVCSTIHPMGRISPFFNSLPLQHLGVRWIDPPLAVTHPFDHEPAAFLAKSLAQTAESLGSDGRAYRTLMQPFVEEGETFINEIMAPIRIPRHPFLMARFGACAVRSASGLINSRFKCGSTRALFAGCAAHSVVALEKLGTASVGMALAVAAHLVGWPLIQGGSQRLIDALEQYLQSLGGIVERNRRIASMKDLPQAKAILFALTARQIATIAAEELPRSFLKKLNGFRYGPGVFKMDWALRGPIPWKDPICSQSATVHLGSTLHEILLSEDAAWNGRISGRPFVLLAQQTLFDSTRAPEGKHTGWAYCHVPHASTADMTEAVESQVERFAPGFRDLIEARHTFNSLEMQEHNANLVGGDIGGGANDLMQFLGRPTFRWNPYATPNPRIFICSSSTPPGGGVHGMCGYRAANSVLKKVFGKSAA